MAGITAATIAAGAGLVSAGGQIIGGIGEKKAAKKELEDFTRQDLENPYKNLQISTLKADQQTEANLSNTATSIEALQRGGTRTVLGGIPRINQSNILLQNLISQDIEDQRRERDLLIARGEENITAIRERREEGALQGIGQRLQTARQDTASGVTNLISGGLALGSSLNANSGVQKKPFQFDEPSFDFSDFNY